MSLSFDTRSTRRLARDTARRERRLAADRELAAAAIGEVVTATAWVSPSSPWWLSLTVVASFSLAAWAGAMYLLAAVGVTAVVVFTERWRRRPRILLAATGAGVSAVHFRYRRVHRVMRLLGHEFAPTSPGSGRWTVGSQVAAGDREQLEALALAAGVRRPTVVALQPRWPRGVVLTVAAVFFFQELPLHWLWVLGAAAAVHVGLLIDRATTRHALMFHEGTWQLWCRDPRSGELTSMVEPSVKPFVDDHLWWWQTVEAGPRTFATNTVDVRRMRRVDPRV